MSLPKYDSYTASDIEWLGEVPEHWKIVPLKYLVRLKSGGTPAKDNRAFWNGSVPWASAKDLKADIIFDTADHITEAALSLGGAELITERGVLVLVRGMTLAHSFPVVVAGRPMAINQDLKALVARKGLQQAFLAWLLRGSAKESLSRIDEAGHGTKALRMEAWTSLRLPVPPSSEQLAIATFLDRETAKIDALVDEQKRLIELLKEKRQAVISHAVTKGLDPNAPVKDSGVEWLGQVPEHWSVGRLGRWLDILSGYAFPSAAFTDDRSATRLLRGVNVGVQKVSWTETVYWERQPNDGLDRFALSVGELVIGMDRPWITEGTRVAVLGPEDVPCLLLQRVAALRPRLVLERMYLYLMLQSREFVDFLTPDMTGVSVPHISPEQIREYPVAIPPTSEQIEIVRYVEGQVTRTVRLIGEAQCAVALLQERRSALISAAVTGKIDVRSVPAEIADAAA